MASSPVESVGLVLQDLASLTKPRGKDSEPKKGSTKRNKLDTGVLALTGNQRIDDTIQLVKDEGERVGDAVVSILGQLQVVIDEAIELKLSEADLGAKAASHRKKYQGKFKASQNEVKGRVDDFLATYSGEDSESDDET